jgi:hypothetical protein
MAMRDERDYSTAGGGRSIHAVRPDVFKPDLRIHEVIDASNWVVWEVRTDDIFTGGVGR